MLSTIGHRELHSNVRAGGAFPRVPLILGRQPEYALPGLPGHLQSLKTTITTDIVGSVPLCTDAPAGPD